jgi:hypothetical protein
LRLVAVFIPRTGSGVNSAVAAQNAAPSRRTKLPKLHEKSPCLSVSMRCRTDAAGRRH